MFENIFILNDSDRYDGMLNMLVFCCENWNLRELLRNSYLMKFDCFKKYHMEQGGFFSLENRCIFRTIT